MADPEEDDGNDFSAVIPGLEGYIQDLRDNDISEEFVQNAQGEWVPLADTLPVQGPSLFDPEEEDEPDEAPDESADEPDSDYFD